MHPLMDSSLMKFLEEDEDETMYLGDEFDAYIAALNREIEEENSSTSQPPTGTDGGIGQAANSMNQPAHLQVDFGLLLPDIQSQIDKDRAMQVQGLYNRLKTGNIHKREFLQHMRSLVGEHIIKMAVYRFQSSFSTYGNPGGNYHTGASPNMNMSSLSLQARQDPIHPIRTHGGGPIYFTSSSPNSSHWQPSMHKDQSLMSSMAYGKPDHMDQMNEQQHKTLVSAPQGPSSFSPGQHEQVRGVLGSSKDITFEMLSSRPGFSTPMNKPEPKSITAQLEYQNASAGNLSSGAGNDAKAIPKKLTVTQKKPFEAAPSVSSLSGVNLQEEEELLFSGSKKESRISETSRKVVQEEEERLFLQKIPLQKKLTEIKERMHGLITNLIRLTKQVNNDEMRATAANVAARAALGGDDTLLKWKIMAEQARHKRKGGPDASASQPSPTKNSLNNQDLSQSSDIIPRTVSVKDVISVLETEIQILRSTLIYHLYEHVHSDSVSE
ncbi:hypothetical protein L1987_66425 [Smallanthus sonchifolius]|uniref:Uncharacterized protein n=1 Tax=Smallanthus sonchifolius TaxID=185202 RepID=A0ACB9BXH2_9ASTR|nr:hypothetical protein L1987_66425 [Smallanthus sonchifolius]